ncbi:uncharacterized protein DUF2505 [Mumia flava]|uniref:Uncharacterized protein DUF2505 n=1 Tax=Mumia flava TaxID=1348852 RepID=A0A0B2B3U0_9ACTN|nr:DUF2505 domain-containing protein [Mumia flava]PJJ58557.1 uncharacterized protein DUF2505 [Mumia flava]
MKLRESAEYPGATCEQVFALVTDDDFRAEVCEKIDAIAYEVTVTHEGEDTRIVIDRTLPADLPDFIKKLTGDVVDVRQTEVWGPADADGVRHGRIDMVVKGQPASMAATGTIRRTASGAEVLVEGEVTVKIPFIGKKVEPMIGQVISAALRTEAEQGRLRLQA